MILVTGAMGRIGTAAVRALHQSGHPVRALVPARRRVPWLTDLPINIAEGELDNGKQLGAALDGVGTVLLVARPALDQVAMQERVIDACVSVGVVRIIKLSVAEAAPEAVSDAARRHWRTEQYLRRVETEGAVVRAMRLMQELHHQVPLLLTQHMLVSCQGEGATADVDADDVGRVLAAVATSPRVPDTPVLVTGPEALTRAEMTVRLSAAWGAPLHCMPCSPPELRQTLLAAGLPRWQVQAMVAFEETARRGSLGQVTSAVHDWTGRPPRSFADFAQELARTVRYAEAPRTTATLEAGAAGAGGNRSPSGSGRR